MNDQELNEAVARKLGWTYFPAGGFSGWGYKTLEPTQATPPDYCHDIKAAWEIVALLQKQFAFVDLEGTSRGWRCLLSKGWNNETHHESRISADANTAPMAICLAFLQLNDTRSERT